jgi:anti-sigma factor RsiW
MTRHAKQTDLALFASGDLSPWRRLRLRMHLGRCAQCREIAAAYRADREWVKQEASRMPAGVDWEHLAAEMTANIRVGLEAGECVSPRRRKRAALATRFRIGRMPIRTGFGWAAAAAALGVTLLIGVAMWLNFPSSDKEVLGRAMSQLWHGRGITESEEPGPVVEASASGIVLRGNGGSLQISQGELRPVAVSVSAQGSASASYVDADTGQMTITSVYVH